MITRVVICALAVFAAVRLVPGAIHTTQSPVYDVACSPAPAHSASFTLITRARDGNLWFLEEEGAMVGRRTPSGEVTACALPVAPSAHRGIAAGADGSIWFTERDTDRIAHLSRDWRVSEYSLPAGSQPWAIISGPDGNIWFTEVSGRVGRITPQGRIVEFATSGDPLGITVGPDRALWFTENDGNRIGRLTVQGKLREFPVSAYSFPSSIASGPDSALWFAESDGRIGRLTMNGRLQEFQVAGYRDEINDLIAGPHGTLWFTETPFVGSQQQLGQLDLRSGGVIRLMPLRYHSSITYLASHVAIDPNGTLWYTEGDWRSIGRMSPLGTVTELAL